MKKLIVAALVCVLSSSLALAQSSGTFPAGGGGGGTPGGSNTQIQYNASGAFAGDSTFTFDATKKTVTTGAANVSAGGIYGAAGYLRAQPTGTDTDTTSSGTIASTYVNAIKSRTLASTSATTLTTAAGLFVDTPVQGTNVTLTNNFALIASTSTQVGVFGMNIGGNAAGFRSYAFTSSGGGIRLQRWADAFASASSTIWAADGSDAFHVSAGFFLDGIGTDAGQTDRTLCRDVSSSAVYFGSGTLGICLGTSSARFKHLIKPADEGLAQIEKLKPVRFYFNDEKYGNTKKEYRGFIAEDVIDAMPDLVGLDKDGRPNSVDMIGMIPALVKAVQQQQVEIVELKRQLANRN